MICFLCHPKCKITPQSHIWDGQRFILQVCFLCLVGSAICLGCHHRRNTAVSATALWFWRGMAQYRARVPSWLLAGLCGAKLGSFVELTSYRSILIAAGCNVVHREESVDFGHPEHDCESTGALIRKTAAVFCFCVRPYVNKLR